MTPTPLKDIPVTSLEDLEDVSGSVTPLGSLPARGIVSIQDPKGDDRSFTSLEDLEDVSSVTSLEDLENTSMSEWQSGGLGAAQGLSFNFADEAEAGIRLLAKLGIGEDNPSYDAILESVRNRYARAQQDNPKSYGTGLIAGGAASTMLPIVGQGGRAAQLVGALGRGSKVAKGALLGAAEGGVAGLGGSEDKRLEDVLLGATVGATTGGVGSSAAGLGRSAVKKMKLKRDLRKEFPKEEFPVGARDRLRRYLHPGVEIKENYKIREYDVNEVGKRPKEFETVDKSRITRDPLLSPERADVSI